MAPAPTVPVAAGQTLFYSQPLYAALGVSVLPNAGLMYLFMNWWLVV